MAERTFVYPANAGEHTEKIVVRASERIKSGDFLLITLIVDGARFARLARPGDPLFNGIALENMDAGETGLAIVPKRQFPQ